MVPWNPRPSTALRVPWRVVDSIPTFRRLVDRMAGSDVDGATKTERRLPQSQRLRGLVTSSWRPDPRVQPIGKPLLEAKAGKIPAGRRFLVRHVQHLAEGAAAWDVVGRGGIMLVGFRVYRLSIDFILLLTRLR